ncbi:hypothetical protein NM688_g4334 [Phlebia brevispora]|uniref:Uncharacterized protein n=1 Tax=Phlebia brevispora TaxID=194682 RepID=A0ACC1T380_9APHY|nr:hypothetical protein NM688_g4334 [Phlebia brevispora]
MPALLTASKETLECRARDKQSRQSGTARHAFGLRSLFSSLYVRLTSRFLSINNISRQSVIEPSQEQPSGGSIDIVEDMSTRSSTGTLPAELVIMVFLYADVVDVVHCRAVCKKFLSIIDTSQDIQHHIEFGVAGLVPNAYYQRTRAEWISTLKELQTRRKQPTITMDASLLSSADSLRIRYGNLFLAPYRSLLSNGLGRPNALRCLSLTFEPPNGTEEPLANIDELWDEVFDFGFDCVRADQSSGILVLYDDVSHRRVHTYDHHNERLKFSLEHLYGRKLDPEVRIRGDVVAVAQYAYRHDLGTYREQVPFDGHLQVTLVNWKTGKIVARLLHPSSHSRRLASLKTFVLLSSTSFLIAMSFAECLVLELYAFGPGITPASSDDEVASPAHIAVFGFPSWKPGCWVDISAVAQLTHDAAPPSYGANAPPFTTSQDACMLSVRMEIHQSREESKFPSAILPPTPRRNPVEFGLVAKLKPFHDAITKYKSLRPTRPFIERWNAWGPRSSRCFGSEFSPLKLSHGFWFVVRERHPAKYLVLDFNVLDIRRDISRASARKDPSLVLEPAVIQEPDVFLETVKSYLPYRKSIIGWAEGCKALNPSVMLGGNPWVVISEASTMSI